MNLAGHSRLWIFQADRTLSDDDEAYIHAELKQFIQGWASHGNELYGEHEILYGFFVLVAADESKSPTSGCSIDALTRKMKAIGEHLQIDFFNRMNTVYEDASTAMHLVDVEEFKNLIKKGEVTSESVVYNNLVTKVSELDNQWRTKVKDSWHNNLIDTL